MKYFCDQCEGEPCVVDVDDCADPPDFCPYSAEFVDWKKLKWNGDMMSKEAISCETCGRYYENCIDCGGCENFSQWITKIKDPISSGCVDNDNDNGCGGAWPITDTYAEPKKRGKILMKALDIINGERQDQYGNPEDSFALIGEYWGAYLKSKGWVKEKIDDKLSPRESAEMMMLFKLARMSGQKPKLDNYLDLVGYAGIAADMIKEDD